MMQTTKHNKKWAILLGCGLALSPIHNQWLTNLATNSKGETLFFLPAFGYLLLLMGVGLFLANNWEQIKAKGWGDKRIVIPMLVIIGAISLSGITADGWSAKIAPLGMGVALFALYLSARVMGKDVFLPLLIGAGVASLGVIAHSIIIRGYPTGGYIFEKNYDIVVGYVLCGLLLFVNRYQWLLFGLVAPLTIFLTGAPEGIFALGVVGCIILLRRDWSWKLVIVIVPTLIVIAVWFGIGWGQMAYEYTNRVIHGDATLAGIEGNIAPEVSAVNYRLEVIKYAMTHLKPLGEGYNLTNFSKVLNVHNVPLVLIQQLGWPGILAVLAWLWVSIWCLVKTKMKYAWTLILALSVFDHFIWTQLAPVWWILAGVSCTNITVNDYIFKREGICEVKSMMATQPSPVGK